MNPLTQLKSLVLPLMFFSLISNLTILVSPIYMMQVLDRVVPSGNISTLALLLAIALGVIGTHAFVEFYRDVSLSRVQRWVEQVCARSAVVAQGETRQDMIENIGRVGRFFSHGLATTALNMPWAPLFLFALFLIHPMFPVLVVLISLAIIAIKYSCEFLTADIEARARDVSRQEAGTLADATDQQVVVGIRAILENLTVRYFELQGQRHGLEEKAAITQQIRAASLGFIRTSAQLLSLSLGAFLVVRNELTAGGMIGASIITSKLISNIETSLNNWGDIRMSHRAFLALGRQLKVDNVAPTEIEQFTGEVIAKNLIVPRGGGAPPRLDRVTLNIGAGECLAIVGGSGSGKTTLLHALSGVMPATMGSVLLDESDVRTLGPQTITKFIGYLPQQARLVKGTIAENISSFEKSPKDNRIIDAARVAGVHGLISALPQAYETDIGQTPFLLSAGQKQRVALARAIYQKPKYLFLDEPNALLDSEGERQLCDTLATLKANGTTIIMVLHRSGIMGLADKVLMLDNGRMADFGPRGEVLGRMSENKQRIKIPLNPASVQDLNDWIVAQFSRHSDREFCQKAAMVGVELFNAACLNGPENTQREAVFTFRFQEEHQCELVLQEERETDAEAKMPKIKSLIRHPEVSMIDLPSDEIALAVLAQMADELDVSNVDRTSVFSALLSSDKSKRDVTRAQQQMTH